MEVNMRQTAPLYYGLPLEIWDAIIGKVMDCFLEVKWESEPGDYVIAPTRIVKDRNEVLKNLKPIQLTCKMWTEIGNRHFVKWAKENSWRAYIRGLDHEVRVAMLRKAFADHGQFFLFDTRISDKVLGKKISDTYAEYFDETKEGLLYDFFLGKDKCSDEMKVRLLTILCDIMPPENVKAWINEVKIKMPTYTATVGLGASELVFSRVLALQPPMLTPQDHLELDIEAAAPAAAPEEKSTEASKEEPESDAFASAFGSKKSESVCVVS